MVLLREGILKKKCVHRRLMQWKPRKVTLDDIDTFGYFSKKENLQKSYTLTYDTKISVKGNVFILKLPTEKLSFKAKTLDERRIWVSNLNAVIAQLKLNEQNALKNSASQTKNKLSKIRETATSRKLVTELPRNETQKKCNTISYELENQTFEVDTIYLPKRIIGRGAYGIVFEAEIKTRNKSVAIKKIPNVFQNSLDAKRILREIRLLRLLRHPNIAHVIDLMRNTPIDNSDSFEDVYLVMDIMDTDLQTIISSSQSLSLDHIKYLIFQLLKALVYLESANILHRDLKPQNLLVNSKCELRICDFGLARTIALNETTTVSTTQQVDNDMTTYVVTRWYRAPELLLASGDYTGKIDIWSSGCIFSELLTRVPLFTGEDFLNQLDKIIDIIGSPTEEELAFVSDGSPGRYIRELAKREPVNLRQHHINTALERTRQLLPIEERSKVNETTISSSITVEAIEALQPMIRFSPNYRVTAKEALSHKFFDNYKSYDIPISSIKLDLREIQEISLETEHLREAVKKEISTFRPNTYHYSSLSKT